MIIKQKIPVDNLEVVQEKLKELVPETNSGIRELAAEVISSVGCLNEAKDVVNNLNTEQVGHLLGVIRQLYWIVQDFTEDHALFETKEKAEETLSLVLETVVSDDLSRTEYIDFVYWCFGVGVLCFPYSEEHIRNAYKKYYPMYLRSNAWYGKE